MTPMLHKTGAKQFRIDEALYQSRTATRQIATRSGPVARGSLHRVCVGGAPTWRQRLGKLLNALVNLVSIPDDDFPEIAAVPVAAPLPAPVPARAIGASPTHYRAFSLLQPRIRSAVRSGSGREYMQDGHTTITAFRVRTKAIKDVTDQAVNDAACVVLDTFVKLVDAFVPLWTSAGDTEGLLVGEIGTGARVPLKEDLLETVERLDAELTRILTPGEVSRDRFETVQRFVETRYAAETDDYRLTPVQ